MARYFEYHEIPSTDKKYALMPESLAWILNGSANTRTKVRADGGDLAPTGSVYFSNDGGATTAPKVYFKIANAKADADWERLVTAAAD